MPKKEMLNILKGAILMEQRGKALYQHTALQTSNDGVRQIFETLADEEDKHIRYLTDYFAGILKNDKAEPAAIRESPAETHKSILADEVLGSISGAGYEAAAISAAIHLENNAISYYSEQSHKAENQAAKDMFDKLVHWEKTHLKILTDLDKELRERIWHDSNVWPVI